MEDKNYELTYRNLVEKVNDIAGFRIICPFKDNIFSVVDLIKKMPDIHVLKEKDYVKAGRKVTFEELAYLKKELEALGYPVFPSQANYVFFRGPSDLYEQLEKKKILIRDCSNYTGLSMGYFRVAVKSHLENQLLIGALKELEQENKDALAGLKPDICPVGSK